MTSQSPKPTIVLVHGAFEDGSIWKEVIQRLQRDGYHVIVFGNPLRGVSVDTAYLRSVLDRIDGPVILVAHSYGGAVITQADKFHSQVAADVSKSEADMLLATQRQMDKLCLTEAPTVAAWTNKPTWQIMTTKDLAIPLAEQKFEAARAKSHSIEIDASHAVTVSNPGTVADVIEQAIRATT